jgi:hypothetical protein
VIRSSATSSGQWRRCSTTLWMAASFLVGAALAAIVFGVVGAHDRVGAAMRLTARWSFLLFWLAYTGSAMATLWSYAGDWVTRSIRRRGEPAFR